MKTRLAQSLGAEDAANLYKLIAERLAAVLADAALHRLDVIVTFDPAEREKEVREWLPGHEHYLTQRGAALGERLHHAFDRAFSMGYAKVMALGSDTLELTLKHIIDGRDMLKGKSVVVGPAVDGGYYLIGMSAFYPEVFVDIPWSTATVFDCTLERLRRNKLTWGLLPMLRDLDEAEDCKNLNAIIKGKG